jgi:DNA invertase Pin-like site-specific DNA recombinase
MPKPDEQPIREVPNRPAHWKLSFAAAEDIRRRVAAGESKNLLAKEYGVSKGTMWLLLRHKIWSRELEWTIA